MGNWRDLYTDSSGDLIHPDAPAGGGGPGFFRAPGPTGASFDDTSFVPHPDAPSARLGHHDFAQFDLQERLKCVSEAITKAQSLVGPAIQEETGYALKELLAGILPGLVLTLSILAGSAALGGMVGSALGALAGGVGALPGAAGGATAGFEAGLFILNLLGIGFLAFYLAKHLSEVTSLLARGVGTAWDAPASPQDTRFEVNAAAADLAHAIAVLMRLILEAIVAYLLTKGAASASSRVTELVAQLRKSKLGEGFAGWVEKNWEGLLGNKKLRKKVEKSQLGAGADASPKPPSPSNRRPVQSPIKRRRSAEEVNREMMNEGHDPAWMRGTDVIERDALPGERYQMAVSSDQATKLMNGDMRGLGGWGSQDSVPNQTYARDALAISQKYKPDVSYVAEIEVIKPVPIKEGIAGSQGGLAGGGNQMEIDVLPKQRGEFFKVLTVRPLEKE